MRRIPRVALLVLLAMAGLYAGDYLSARYRIPGNRPTLGSVQVQTFYAVRQKDGRIEYLLGGAEAQTCLRSLFPHLGYTPCWYLTRHSTKRIEVSRVRHRCRPLNARRTCRRMVPPTPPTEIIAIHPKRSEYRIVSRITPPLLGGVMSCRLIAVVRAGGGLAWRRRAPGSRAGV